MKPTFLAYCVIKQHYIQWVQIKLLNICNERCCSDVDKVQVEGFLIQDL